MPILESLDIYTLDPVIFEDWEKIHEFIALYEAKGKRANCTQFI